MSRRCAPRQRRDSGCGRETVGEYASTAPPGRGQAHEGGDAARETVGDYAASARETVNDYATSAASSAKTCARSRGPAPPARRLQVDQRLGAQENPLVAGALAVAVGAAIGLAFRATEYEDPAMGATRDQALRKGASCRQQPAAERGREGAATPVQYRCRREHRGRGQRDAEGAEGTGVMSSHVMLMKSNGRRRLRAPVAPARVAGDVQFGTIVPIFNPSSS